MLLQKKMRFVSRTLILGFRKTSSIFPETEDIMEEIFRAFNVKPANRAAATLIFQKHWHASSNAEPGLQHDVIAAIRNFRGRRADKLREGLYEYFHIHKPKKRAQQAERDAFLAALGDLRNGDAWRISNDDPYGSDAVHEALSLMMKGPNYDSDPVEITLDVAGFAIHVVSNLVTLL